MTPRLLFVLGTGGCGSTLVHELVARHRQVGWVSNLDDLAPWWRGGRWNGDVFRVLPPALATKGRVRFAPSEGYRSLRREVSPLIVAPGRDLLASDLSPWLADRLRTYYLRRAAHQRVPVFLHKFAGWPRARLLHAVFPDARFVHVYRDGRAVTNSFLQADWWPGFSGPGAWPFGDFPTGPPGAEESFVALAARAWATLIDAFETAQQETPRHLWLNVRYEEVVQHPRSTMGEVLSFSGLDWDGPFERAFRRVAFTTGRTDAFRTNLDPASVRLLDEMLGPQLHRLGYQ